MSDHAVAFLEPGDIGPDVVDCAGEVVADDDGPGFDIEAGLLGGVDGVDCEGAVVDDYVEGTGGGNCAVGDADWGVRGVYEG